MEYSEIEEADQPVGLIFDPLDREVVSYYLKGMAGDEKLCFPGFIHRLDIYQSQPWNLLPSHEFKHGISRKEAFFFTPRYPCSSFSSSTSSKSHVRRTVAGGNGGFWHGKAHDKPIRQSGEVIGRKTSLHFKTTEGIPTDWIMQEYLLLVGRCTTFQSVAICKIYKKSNSHSSKSSPDSLHLHEENKVVEEAAAGPPALSCQRKQPRLLQDYLQVEEAEPPCKKQRRQLLLQQNQQQHDHIDHEVNHGYSEEAVEASTCWLPSSSVDWNPLSSWDIVVGGQLAFAPACPGSDCSKEEIQGLLPQEEATTDCSPNEMFSLAQLLGEKEEEEVIMFPEEADDDEMFSFVQLLEEVVEEEEVVVPEEADDDEMFSFVQFLEEVVEEVVVPPEPCERRTSSQPNMTNSI